MARMGRASARRRRRPSGHGGSVVSAYSRRNERARAAGWASYGEQRRAGERGWSTPSEYRAAKAGRGHRATPVNPYAPARPLRQGGEVGGLPGGRVGIVAPFTPAGLDGDPRGGVRQELNRYSGSRRITIHVGGAQVGRGRGFTVAFVRAMAGAAGGLHAWIVGMLAAGSAGGFASSSYSGIPDDDALVSVVIT